MVRTGGLASCFEGGRWLALTVFGPIFACLLASLEKLGRRRSQERSHGCEVVGIVELWGIIGGIDVEERFRLEQTPCLAAWTC